MSSKATAAKLRDIQQHVENRSDKNAADGSSRPPDATE